MTSSNRHGPKSPRGRHDLLSEEDHALWQHTASTLDSVKRLKPRVHAAIEDFELTPARPRLAGAARVLRERSGDAAEAQTAPGPQTEVPRGRRGVPPLAEIDRKATRRLRSGRVEIEARLDLHGMRQGEAHAALRAFLHSCHAQGRRWVLVITGKGGPVAAGGHEQHGWPGDGGMGSRDRGVLRRNVPRWLAEPDLRIIVVSFTEASVRHGGEGALYIQVRSRGRAGND